MKFSIERVHLLRAVKNAAKAVSEKVIQPSLKHLKIDASEGKVTIEGTNLDFWVRTHCEPDLIETEGSVLVPAKQFVEIIEKLPAKEKDSVRISVNKGQITIACSSSVFKVPTMPATEFPEFAYKASVKSFVAPSLQLVNAISQVSFCVNQADGQGILGSIHLTTEGGVLKTVGTNGSFLGFFSMDCCKGADVKVLLPYKPATALAQIFAGEAETNLIVETEKVWFVVKSPTTHIGVRLLAGDAPSYESMIPDRNGLGTILAGCDSTRMIESLTRVGVVCDKRISLVRLKFDKRVEKPTCEITGNAPDIGEGRDVMALDAIEDLVKPFEIAVNGQYLKQILQATAGGAWIYMTEPLKPIVITDNIVNAPSTYLLMPMNGNAK